MAQAVMLSLALHAPPACGQANACPVGISPDTAKRLFEVLNHPPAEPGCTFEGIATEYSRLQARWSRAGAELPPIVVTPSECAAAGAQLVGRFALDVPEHLTRECPSVGPLIADFVRQLADERPVGEMGSANDPLFRGARLLFAAIVALSFALFARGAARLSSLDARWVALRAASFAAAAGEASIIASVVANGTALRRSCADGVSSSTLPA